MFSGHSVVLPSWLKDGEMFNAIGHYAWAVFLKLFTTATTCYCRSIPLHPKSAGLSVMFAFLLQVSLETLHIFDLIFFLQWGREATKAFDASCPLKEKKKTSC